MPFSPRPEASWSSEGVASRRDCAVRGAGRLQGGAAQCSAAAGRDGSCAGRQSHIRHGRNAANQPPFDPRASDQAQGCARLPGLLEEHRPRLVLVLLGGDDFLRSAPEQDVVTALERCVASARAGQHRPSVDPRPPLRGGGIADAPLYPESGRAWQVAVLDAGLSNLLAQRAMRADAVHLNAAGYRELAMTLVDALRNQGWLAR